MTLTTADVLTRPANFADRVAGLSLARWKWRVLDHVDGARTIAALARACELEADAIARFGEEALAGGYLEIEQISYAEYRAASAPAAAPAVRPVVAAATPKVASLHERVAALKARALTALQESAERPRPEAVEFSLAGPASNSESTSANGNAVEFSL